VGQNEPGLSARVALLVEEDVALDPENVDFLGANGVGFDAKDFADLIEEFGFRVGDNEGEGTDAFGAEVSGSELMVSITNVLLCSAHIARLTMIDGICLRQT
jgi:hypothetical protein